MEVTKWSHRAEEFINHTPDMVETTPRVSLGGAKALGYNVFVPWRAQRRGGPGAHIWAADRGRGSKKVATK